MRAQCVPFFRGTGWNIMEHADYQQYLVLLFYNTLIINVLIGGLQAGFTVTPS